MELTAGPGKPLISPHLPAEVKAAVDLTPSASGRFLDGSAWWETRCVQPRLCTGTSGEPLRLSEELVSNGTWWNLVRTEGAKNIAVGYNSRENKKNFYWWEKERRKITMKRQQKVGARLMSLFWLKDPFTYSAKKLLYLSFFKVSLVILILTCIFSHFTYWTWMGILVKIAQTITIYHWQFHRKTYLFWKYIFLVWMRATIYFSNMLILENLVFWL